MPLYNIINFVSLCMVQPLQCLYWHTFILFVRYAFLLPSVYSANVKFSKSCVPEIADLSIIVLFVYIFFNFLVTCVQFMLFPVFVYRPSLALSHRLICMEILLMLLFSLCVTNILFLFLNPFSFWKEILTIPIHHSKVAVTFSFIN